MQNFVNGVVAQPLPIRSLVESAVGTFVSLDAVRANYAAISRAAGQIRPLLVHVHIPKCGGSSFNEMLRRHAGGAHLDLYSPVPRSVIPVDDMVEHLRARPDARSVASHSIRLFPNILAGRAPLYVTFLRDPREWYISNMTYLIKNYAKLSEEHRAHLPPTCPEMTVPELSTWLLDRNDRENRPPSDVAEFLAGPTYAQHVAPLLPDAAPAQDVADSAVVTLARHLLSRFFFVGTVETFDRDLRLLRDKLATLDIHLPADQDVPWVNTSHELRGDVSWINPSNPAGARILRFLRRDYAVYSHVRRLTGDPLGERPEDATNVPSNGAAA